MSERTTERAGTPDLRQRLIALAGLVAIVGVAAMVLAAAGVLGNQGGGAGIDDALVLDTAPASGQPALGVGPQVGKLAPDFEVSDFDGARHRLSDYRGKVVYLSFWATWCGPCKRELPDIQELLKSHPDDLVVIAVNRSEPLDRAQGFLRNLTRSDGGEGISFTVNGMDPDDTLYNEYRGLGMPVSIFIDANGVVTQVHNGLILLDQMEEALTDARA